MTAPQLPTDMPSTDMPSTDVDLWTSANRLEPFEVYRELRDLGPVVYLRAHDVVALTRYDVVREALTSWEQFSSASGVGLDEELNASLRANVLVSDPPEHTELRRLLAAHLSNRALKDDAPEIREKADRLVAAAVERGEVDGAVDLAQAYSVTVVCDMVGFPAEGRSELPDLAAAAFNVFGPTDERSTGARESLSLLGLHALQSVEQGLLEPGRRGQRMIDAGLDPLSLVNFTWPGIDTTVHGISGALKLFAEHPEAWQRVRADRSLIPAAFAEALRLHSPVHFFTRMVTEPTDIGGATLPAGQRVVLMYGSANRDERKYPDPDRFDLDRNPTDQLSFGRGIHLCVGIHLAKLEGHSFLDALADRVEHIELTGEPTWADNAWLHGLEHLPLRLTPA